MTDSVEEKEEVVIGESEPILRQAQDEKRGWGGVLWEFIKFALIVGLVVIPIRVYIAQPFIVNGLSMHPTFESGDYLIIDEFSYNFLREPERGEVIVFRFPQDRSKFFIKRVIGLPGEEVEIRSGKVYIKSEIDENVLELEESYLPEQVTAPNGKWNLSEGEYFVLGDNRRFSSDSRIWGTLSEENIIGRALLRLWPIASADYLPGNF